MSSLRESGCFFNRLPDGPVRTRGGRPRRAPRPGVLTLAAMTGSPPSDPQRPDPLRSDDLTTPRPTTIDKRRAEHKDPARLSSTTDQRLLDSRGPAEWV